MMERWEVTSEEEQSESMVGKLIDKGMKPTNKEQEPFIF